MHDPLNTQGTCPLVATARLHKITRDIAMSTTQTTTVDDADVQHILYTGDAWYPGGNSSSDYMG